MKNMELGISKSRGYENLEIKGTQEFMGREIPVIYGGFGSGQKVVLAKTIAEIHGMNVGNVNQRINENRNRFKNSVDIIDLKTDTSNVCVLGLGFTKAQVGNAKNIYLLSERGYAKLIKIMDSDLAWEIHDKLMDEYFTMREERANPYANLSPELQMLIKLEQGQQVLERNQTQLIHDKLMDEYFTMREERANPYANLSPELQMLIKLEQGQQVLERNQTQLDNRMTELEENACLTPGEYGMLGQKINSKVHSIIKERGLTLSRQQRSELYKSINRDIKVITGVQTRSQLRQKHLEPVLDLIYHWEPSLATMMKVNQMSLAI